MRQTTNSLKSKLKSSNLYVWFLAQRWNTELDFKLIISDISLFLGELR